MGGGLTGIGWLDAVIVVGILLGVIETFRRVVLRPILEIRDSQRQLVDDLYGERNKWGEVTKPGLIADVQKIRFEVEKNGPNNTLRNIATRAATKADEAAAKAAIHAAATVDLTDRLEHHLAWAAEQAERHDAEMEEIHRKIEPPQ